MKNNISYKRLWSLAAPFAACVIALSPSASTAAPFDSPVGDWDFYFTGQQKGVAQITFENDFTITGLYINAPGKKPKVQERNERGPILDPDDPRNSGGGTTSYDLHYGGATIAGNWGYDLKGKLVGAITLLSDNRTNGLSFKGTVAAGRRITINTTRFDTGAKSVFQGVPRVVQPDLSGNYFVAGKATPILGTGGNSRVELLELTSTSTANYYDVVEYGPGFVGSGFAIVTANKRLGVYTEYFTPGTTNRDIIATSGTFDANRLRGKLSGYDGTNWLTLKIGQPQP